ncbi:MAG: helix-turn-helix domain-containing protein [Planctomycetes bacterium]|nr:helix-turn-helix domain-containing protein [Planctomycetota bacterium]
MEQADGDGDGTSRGGIYGPHEPPTRAADDGCVPEFHGPIPDVLTAVDAAAILKVSLVTVRRHLADGSIPSRKHGRQRHILKEDLLKSLSAKSLRRTR